MKTIQLTSTQALNAINFFLKELKCWQWFRSPNWIWSYIYNAYGSKVGTLQRQTRMTDITESDEIDFADQYCYRLVSFDKTTIYANYPIYNDEKKEWMFINEKHIIQN